MASCSCSLVNFKTQWTRRLSGLLAFGVGILVLSSQVLSDKGLGDDRTPGSSRKLLNSHLVMKSVHTWRRRELERAPRTLPGSGKSH